MIVLWSYWKGAKLPLRAPPSSIKCCKRLSLTRVNIFIVIGFAYLLPFTILFLQVVLDLNHNGGWNFGPMVAKQAIVTRSNFTIFFLAVVKRVTGLSESIFPYLTLLVGNWLRKLESVIVWLAAGHIRELVVKHPNCNPLTAQVVILRTGSEPHFSVPS